MTKTLDLPTLAPVVSKGVYSLCYYLAFGAVYAGQIAIEVLPPDSMVCHGLRDGAEAAHRAFAAKREEHDAAEAEMAMPEEPAEAGGNL